MLIESFKDYLQSQKRYSLKTSTAYCTDIAQIIEFAQSQFEISEISQINSAIIRSWLVDLSEQDTHPSTLKRKLSSLRAYFKYLQKKGVVKANPAKDIVTPKVPGKLPKFLNTTSVEHLFDTGDLFPATFKGKRDKLIFELLYSTGMRRQELIDLTWTQCDFGKKQLKIKGKGNKERMAPLSDHLTYLLEDYRTDVLKKFNLLPQTILIDSNGKSLYPEFVYRRVKKYLQKVTSIDKKSPHVMRHTFATHLSNKGADLNDIKELMGHSSLASTQIYTHSSIDELKKVYKQAHPMS